MNWLKLSAVERIATGLRERRNELSRPATRTTDTLPRLLNAMRRVEDHGHAAGGSHPGKAAHVDDEIAVAEEGAALGEGNLR